MRPITWTASCSSTAWTPAQRKLAMKEIRAAEWWGEPVPVVRVSPHPTHGEAY